jgi:hypothetical protein
MAVIDENEVERHRIECSIAALAAAYRCGGYLCPDSGEFLLQWPLTDRSVKRIVHSP